MDSQQHDTNETNETYSFLQETIKDEKTNPKTWKKSLLVFSSLGIIFGACASFSFVALKPLVESVFSTKEVVSIPLDEEVEEVDQVGDTSEAESSEETRVLELSDFEKMHEELFGVAEQASKGVVSIERIMSGDTWQEEDNASHVTGIIVANMGTDILVLTPSHVLKNAQSLEVTFPDDSKHKAKLKKKDENLGYAILSVDKSTMEQETKNSFAIATLGNSNSVSKGDIIIAIGNQFNYANGLGYGIVSTTDNTVNVVDGEFELIATDIPTSAEGTAVLVNIQGEIVGMMNQVLRGQVDEETVSGVSISKIKSVIEMLSNGVSVPYIGIKGVEITEEIAEQQSMPIGFYVQEVVVDSPAMEAGVRRGDIITDMNARSITNAKAYRGELMNCEVGNIVGIKAQRMGQEGYVDVHFSVTVGSKE